jgi:dienelactone hydrolase
MLVILGVSTGYLVLVPCLYYSRMGGQDEAGRPRPGICSGRHGKRFRRNEAWKAEQRSAAKSTTLTIVKGVHTLCNIIGVAAGVALCSAG